MADTKEKVYLPRMRVRPGFRHSYQGKNVVVVDEKGKTTAGGEFSTISTEKPTSRQSTTKAK
jgi:hypothetical protein